MVRVGTAADRVHVHVHGLWVGHGVLLAMVPLQHLIPQGERSQAGVIAETTLPRTLHIDDVWVHPGNHSCHHKGPPRPVSGVHSFVEDLLRQEARGGQRLRQQLALSYRLIHALEHKAIPLGHVPALADVELLPVAKEQSPDQVVAAEAHGLHELLSRRVPLTFPRIGYRDERAPGSKEASYAEDLMVATKQATYNQHLADPGMRRQRSQ
mmetsp:Transcript_80986/g.173133  ORF Transcript_80986/g.173133 Transcript_80986/m.173133 type:complete len:210 (+) Transcript_80986:421-1050(+)